jgi:tRNA A37 N6-isopentenylltransferase MiaA
MSTNKFTPTKLAEQQAEKIAEQKRSNEKARQVYLDSLEKKKIEAEKEREIIRAKEAANLKNELRSSFKNANPSASDAEFEKIYPSLREEMLKNNTLKALEADKNLSEYQM